jgi:hypothetical protein
MSRAGGQYDYPALLAIDDAVPARKTRYRVRKTVTTQEGLHAGRLKSPHEARNDGMASAPRHDDRKGRHNYTTFCTRYACRL